MEKFKKHYPWLIPLVLLAGILFSAFLIELWLEKEQGKEGRTLNEDTYDRLIYKACEEHMPPGWDWLILKALIKQESKFDPNAENAGAAGLMQFIASTAETMGLSANRRTDPELAVPAGAKYMHTLWDQWQAEKDGPPDWDRTRFALASYNAGPGRVLSAQREAGDTDRYSKLKSHLPEHTQKHVDLVMGYFQEYRSSGKYKKSSGNMRSKRSRIRFWVNPMKKN